MASSVVLPLPQDPYEDISWKVKLSTGFSFAIATTALILRLTSRWLSGIPNIITDFALLFLPLIGLLDMRTALGRSRALQIGAVFALGLVTCVFDIIRFVVMLRFDDSPDITWNNVSASVWTDVEPSMAYLVACLPLLRALVTPLQFWRARGGTRSRAEASEGMSGIELRNRSGPHKKGSAGDISSVRPLSLCQAMRALDSTRLSLVDV
ncbi:MAG: hypothetical protein Q9162_005193 [Coniocarpon cinnabarinum]